MRGRHGEHSRVQVSRRFYPEAIAIIALVVAAWVGAFFAFV